MNILKTVLVSILLFIPVHAFSSELGYMRVTLVEGDVRINSPETGEWDLASINMPLTEGDRIWSPRGSRAELQLNNGTFIRLDDGTELQILSMDRESSQFYLSQGRAYIFHYPPGDGVTQFDTPNASVRAFKRAIFRVDISDRFTDAAVYKGFVKIENNQGTTRVNAGEMLSLGQNTNGELALLGPADEWESWNNERNHRILTRRDGSNSYLPSELRVYSADFDNNGRWVRVPEYGYVWTPTLIIGSDWAPYRTGRWICRGGDYVWVGREPWGWAPYHYGRWAYTASFGWFWVPPIAGDIYWGPGYVGWVRTPEYVAWVPLAPGETYYGRGNFGRHSVNIINVNVTHINVTNVYRNVHTNNGVTVVRHNSFNTPSPAIVNLHRDIVQQKIFTKNNLSMGAPEIKPVRKGVPVNSVHTPQAKLPPQQGRNLKPWELKQARPLTKSPDRSVLNPGAKPRPLKVMPIGSHDTPGTVKPTQGLSPTSPAVEHGSEKSRGHNSVGDRINSKDVPPYKSDRNRFQPGYIGQPGVSPSSTHKIEGPQPQTESKRGIDATERNTSKFEKPRFDREKASAQEGKPLKERKAQIHPPQNRRIESPGLMGEGNEKPRRELIKDGKESAGGSVPKIEKTWPKPADNRHTAPPTGFRVKGEKPDFQPAVKGNSSTLGKPAPNGEKKHAQPAEKGKRGKENELDRGKGNKLNESPEGDKKGR